MIDTALALYEDVAWEYYDPVRHPTCANFREGSAILFRRWLLDLPHETGSFCEVGAGKSLLAELLTAEGSSAANLIITDSSPAMLSYSAPWVGTRTHLVLGDSMMLPISDEGLDLLVSSLGDPYNLPSFWREVSRVLKPGGIAFFTTPAYDWAMAFRNTSTSDLESAEFELVGGESVQVPSWIYPPRAQIEMIEKSGLHVRERFTVAIAELMAQPLSPKLLIDRGPSAEVVEGYLIAKAQD
jgi:SAM-dependent methyltransferase